MHSHAVSLAQDFLAVILTVFVVGTLLSKLALRLRIPDVVLFILIGMLMGPSVLGIVNIGANSALNQVILLFGASFILFHGGIVTSFSVLRDVWRSIALLSTLGVLVTAFIVALAAHYILGLPFLPSLLLGALLASTDPASLVPIFQRFPIRKRVAQTVISESAFTDATGAILTTVILGLLVSGGSVSWWRMGVEFLQLALGGILIGGLIGWLAAFLISENDCSLLRDFTPMVIVMTVLASYLLAEQLSSSGFMSAFTAGVMVGNASSLRLNIQAGEADAMHQFIDAIGLKLRMLIFTVLGTQVDFMVLGKFGFQSVLVVLVFIVLARPMTVLSSLLPDRKASWQRPEMLFFFWTRETGVIAAALIGIVASSNLPGSNIMTSTTFVAILLTLGLQASTTPFVARKLGLMHEDT